jgi:uncharacterized BrkB/YihY/UPF0761 family membrane protein
MELPVSARIEWVTMFSRIWRLLRDSVQAFIADDALSRGASISFYTITSIGPVLFIVVAIAGLVFGEDAARGAIASQLSELMGRASADLVQTVPGKRVGQGDRHPRLRSGRDHPAHHRLWRVR